MSWDEFVELMHDNEDTDNYDETIFEELFEIHNNPININSASEQDLSILPFLTINQIRDILFYRETNGQLLSLGELMLITSLDKRTRECLRLFCYVGELPTKKVTIKDIFHHSSNEIVTRTDVSLNKKAGFTQYPDSILIKNPNKVYLGTKPYASIRYKFSSMNHIDAGFQLEKDPGESGVDYFSGYAMVQDIGMIQKAIVGNYKISFGQGLVINKGTLFGKTMMLGSIGRMDRGITKHSSFSESGYFTGGAASIRIKSFLLSGYVSLRNADGTFNSDSSGITSLKTDGYHRTLLERSKKGNTMVLDYGGNIHWDYRQFQVSATIAATHYSNPLKPQNDTNSSLYRLYYAQGNDFLAYSLAYAYRGKRLVLAGETASSTSGGIATLNSAQLNINSSNNLTVIQRFYSYKYVSINGKAFGENSSVQNEDGIYIGWNSNISNKLKLSAYIDGMYFPWFKYQVSSSSYGIEGAAQVSYSPSSKLEFTARYKIKAKQKDYKYQYTNSSNKKDTITYLQYNTNQNLRLQCQYSPNEHLSFKTSLCGVLTSFGPQKPELGYSIGEAIQWTDTDKHLRFNLSVCYFNTDSYNARIYNYESSLLYTFGMSSYYYQGIRATLLASFPIIKNLYFTTKMGMTKYFNKETIGSGLNLIEQSHKEDIQLQIRWKF